MFRNILVGLDGSSHGQAALELAIDLAARAEGRVIGSHVLDVSLLRGPFLHDLSGALGLEPQLHLTGELEQLLGTRADAVLEAFEARCREASIPYRAIKEQGHIADVLADQADLADLVVIGRRGASFDTGQDRTGGRGTAQQLLKLSPSPVILTGLARFPLRRVMVAYDAGAGAHHALKDAARLCSIMKLDLVVAHVQEKRAHKTGEPLNEARVYLEPYPLDAHFVGGDGDRIVRLIELMEREDCDLLCLGYRGAHRLRGIALGHSAETLMKQMKQPLWVSP